MTIPEIKTQLPIATVLSHYGLEVDRNSRLCCPFHEDKTPSMQVYAKTDTAFCFSANCKAHGAPIDVIDFVMYRENLSKHESIVKCKALIGGVPQVQPVAATPTVPQKTRIATLKAVFTHFQKAYKKNEAAKNYMKSRSIEHVQEIGYHAGTLSKALIEKLKTLDIVAAWGVGCIIFPLKNTQGEIKLRYVSENSKRSTKPE